MARITDDTTIDDEWQEQRLDALPDDLRDLAAQHELDQLKATPAYAERFVEDDDSWKW